MFDYQCKAREIKSVGRKLIIPGEVINSTPCPSNAEIIGTQQLVIEKTVRVIKEEFEGHVNEEELDFKAPLYLTTILRITTDETLSCQLQRTYSRRPLPESRR